MESKYAWLREGRAPYVLHGVYVSKDQKRLIFRFTDERGEPAMLARRFDAPNAGPIFGLARVLEIPPHVDVWDPRSWRPVLGSRVIAHVTYREGRSGRLATFVKWHPVLDVEADEDVEGPCSFVPAVASGGTR